MGNILVDSNLRNSAKSGTVKGLHDSIRGYAILQLTYPVLQIDRTAVETCLTLDFEVLRQCFKMFYSVVGNSCIRARKQKDGGVAQVARATVS